MNGNGTKYWMAVALFLAGMVVSGAGMVIRGDFLGKVEAQAVEQRLNERMDRELDTVSEDIREIKQTLQRMEDRQR